MLANLDIAARGAPTISNAQKKADRFSKSSKKLRQKSREARPTPKFEMPANAGVASERPRGKAEAPRKE